FSPAEPRAPPSALLPPLLAIRQGLQRKVWLPASSVHRPRKTPHPNRETTPRRLASSPQAIRRASLALSLQTGSVSSRTPSHISTAPTLTASAPGHSSNRANHTSRRLQPLYICTTGIRSGPCSSSGDALHAHTLVRRIHGYFCSDP